MWKKWESSWCICISNFNGNSYLFSDFPPDARPLIWENIGLGIQNAMSFQSNIDFGMHQQSTNDKSGIYDLASGSSSRSANYHFNIGWAGRAFFILHLLSIRCFTCTVSPSGRRRSTFKRPNESGGWIIVRRQTPSSPCAFHDRMIWWRMTAGRSGISKSIRSIWKLSSSMSFNIKIPIYLRIPPCNINIATPTIGWMSRAFFSISRTPSTARYPLKPHQKWLQCKLRTYLIILNFYKLHSKWKFAPRPTAPSAGPLRPEKFSFS